VYFSKKWEANVIHTYMCICGNFF